MVATGRIDIAGQMGLCDQSEVTISRSMPAVMEERMNDFAWKSFCDKMDEALKPVTMAKKIMAFGIGGTMTVAFTFIIVGFVTFATLASNYNTVSSFGHSTSPALGMIPFGVGMVLMIVGSVGSSCYASSKSSEAMNAMKKVCEDTSAMHQGISFHIRDEMRFLGGEATIQMSIFPLQISLKFMLTMAPQLVPKLSRGILLLLQHRQHQ